MHAYQHSITDEVAIRNVTDEGLVPQKQGFFILLVMNVCVWRKQIWMCQMNKWSLGWNRTAGNVTGDNWRLINFNEQFSARCSISHIERETRKIAWCAFSFRNSIWTAVLPTWQLENDCTVCYGYKYSCGFDWFAKIFSFLFKHWLGFVYSLSYQRCESFLL